MKIYQYDNRKIYNGINKEIKPSDGAPIGWTRAVPLNTNDGEVNLFRNGQWIIINKADAPKYPGILETAPEFVSKGQARRWLIKQGIMPSMVTQEIAKIPDEIQRELAMSYWEDQTQYNRFNPLMIQIGTAFGFDTEEKLAQAFIEASQED